jgi:hypothetical protein
VYQYLGRYTHRVAISNGRLLTMDDHTVVFRTRGDETASLPPTEFIGLFLQHILPKGFVKIRHFGLMSSGNVTGKLERARALLPAVATDPSSEASDDYQGDETTLSPGSLAPDLAWPDLLLALTGKDVALCPRCQQRTIQRQALPPARAPPQNRSAA